LVQLFGHINDINQDAKTFAEIGYVKRMTNKAAWRMLSADDGTVTRSFELPAILRILLKLTFLCHYVVCRISMHCFSLGCSNCCCCC